MRKLLCFAFVFLSAFAFGQTTAVVTGNLVDQSETGTTSGISVDVTLVNTGSQRCFVSGTGTVVTEKKNYTAAQILAGITLAKTANITCGASSGQSRWRFSFKNSALNTSRDCDLQISANTSLNTATCLQATTTPTTTVPTSSLYWLLDGSNSPTGNLVPAVNGTQSIGTSGSRWSMFATTLDASGNVSVGGTLGVTGTSTLANVTLGGANTLTVANIKQVALTSFAIADPLGVSHFFISNGSPYTNTFINGNGAGVVFLGSAAKTNVDDVTGNITLSGSTSGTSILKASAVAGAGTTLTLPAATGTLSCNSCTQTLTATTITNLAITGGGTNRSLIFNGSAQVANGNTTDDGTNFSTGAVKLQVQGGVAQGSGLKHQRFGTLCSTAASAGTSCTTAVTWTSAFADANYTVTCTGITQSNFPSLAVESIAAAGFTIRISTSLASAATFTTVDCIAAHD